MTTTTLTVNEPERELLLGALRTAHTWTLDALASSLTHNSRDSIVENVKGRASIRRLARQLGEPIDDSYRMGHIRELAAKGPRYGRR